MLLSTKQIMARYNVSRSTIYNWRQKHNFPEPFSHGRWYLQDIEIWEARRANAINPDLQYQGREASQTT
jgi:predicted DNA-binding transcriptional regulator AlpA